MNEAESKTVGLQVMSFLNSSMSFIGWPGWKFAIAVMLQLAMTTSNAPARQSPVSEWARLRGSRVGFQIPQPISSKECDRYAVILGLSDGQAVYLHYAHKQYRERCKQLELDHFATLLAAADAMMSRPVRSTLMPEDVTNSRALQAAELEFTNGLVQLERGFFMEIGSVLAEAQRPWLRRVEMHRERARRWLHSTTIAKSRVDLSSLVEAMGLSIDELARFEPVMWEYEQVVTPAMAACQADHQRIRTLIRENMVRRKFDDEGNPLDQTKAATRERIDALIDEWDAAFRQRLENARQVARINDEFLPKFVDALSVERATRLKRAILELSFPRVYPDVADPEPAFEDILESEQMPAELRVALEGVWREYRQGYEALCKQMCAASEEWQAFCTLWSSHSGWEAYYSDMEKRWDQRLRKSQDVWKRIVEALPLAVRQEKSRVLEEQQLRFEQALASKKRVFPPYATME